MCAWCIYGDVHVATRRTEIAAHVAGNRVDDALAASGVRVHHIHRPTVVTTLLTLCSCTPAPGNSLNNAGNDESPYILFIGTRRARVEEAEETRRNGWERSK